MTVYDVILPNLRFCKHCGKISCGELYYMERLMKNRLFTMFMSIVLAAGSFSPVYVHASEETVETVSVDEVTVSDDDTGYVPDGDEDTVTDEEDSSAKKKKKTPAPDPQPQPQSQEEPAPETPEVEVSEEPAPPAVQEVIIPDELPISEEVFNEVYAISENVIEEIADINMSALNNVLIYEEGTKDIWMIKGQKLRMPSENWALKEKEDKQYFLFKKETGTARKGAADVTLVSTEDPDMEIFIHIQDPRMSKPAMVLAEGETAEVDFAYDSEHFHAAWYSSDPNVVKVSGNKVTGIGKGTAIVSVYVGGQRFNKKVKVREVSPIREFDDYINMVVGQSTAVRFRDGFKNKGAQWEVISGNEIAEDPLVSLDSTGKLTAIKPGTARIRAVDVNDEVRILEVRIDVHEKELYLNTGKSKGIKHYKVKNTKDEKAVWTSADPEIATVNERGRVTAGNVSGNTVISCSFNGVEYKTTVYVEDPMFETDRFLKETDGQYMIALEEGSCYELKPMGIYRDIFYVSSSPTVAFVDEYGFIQARTAGHKATVTADINGRKIDIKVIVRSSKKTEKPAKCLNVVDFGAIPYDGEDDQAAINAAIETAALMPEYDYTVYVPEGYYNIEVGFGPAIKLKDNVKLIMDNMAVLHVNATNQEEYSVISIKDAKNVLVQGGQLEGGRDRHVGTTGQWGYGVVVGTLAESVEIRDMIIYDNWGDGIYIYSSIPDDPPNDIHIVNCDLYNNRRSNISVIDADDLLIEDCVIDSANGHAPMSGVNLEPNRIDGAYRLQCTNIKIKNCILSTPEGRPCSSDEIGRGIYYSFMVLRGAGATVADNVEVEDCVLNGDVDSGDSEHLSFRNTTINGTFYYDMKKEPKLDNCRTKEKQGY